MVNIDHVIEKIKKAKNLNKEAEVADLFGLSPADFSNRKKRGTLLPLIVEWGINENVNLDFLLKNGDSYIHVDTKTGKTSEEMIAEDQLRAYADELPEPVEKALQVMLENPDQAWEFYALVLERADKAKKQTK